MTMLIVTIVLTLIALAARFMMKPSKRREQTSVLLCAVLVICSIIGSTTTLSNWRFAMSWLIAGVIFSIYLVYCISEVKKYPDDYEDEVEAEEEDEEPFLGEDDFADALDDYSDGRAEQDEELAPF